MSYCHKKKLKDKINISNLKQLKNKKFKNQIVYYKYNQNHQNINLRNNNKMKPVEYLVKNFMYRPQQLS